MALAAVPLYLGNDFKQASPALRFGMLLPLWGVDQRTKQLLWEQHDVAYELRGSPPQERRIESKNKTTALQQATSLNPSDKRHAKELNLRMRAAFSTIPARSSLLLQALSTAPFTTGLGNEHPLENGFSFLSPYGLPYLSGSSIKGVLRQAVRELCSGEWGPSAWSTVKRYPVCEVKSTVQISMVDLFFGLEGGDGQTQQFKGALSFWDSMPEIRGDNLMVDVMTPHQTHYYQDKDSRKSDDKQGAGSQSPHDSGAPNPICFLTVPPESSFPFFVLCDCDRLVRYAPELAEEATWKKLVTDAFEHAFSWLGFGAKSAIGYGAMVRDSKAEAAIAESIAEKLNQQAKAARFASMSDQRQLIEAFVEACEKRFAQLKGQRDNPNTELHGRARSLAAQALTDTQWSQDDRHRLAEVLLEWLPKVIKIDMKDERKKLKLMALRGESP